MFMHVVHGMSRLASMAVIIVGFLIPRIATAEVLLISSVESSDAQVISDDAIDFFTFNADETKNEKAGDPVDYWMFSSGMLKNGVSHESISWTDGTPVAAATGNSTWYIPLGSGYGVDQVSEGGVSFTLSDSSQSLLTLYTRPNGNFSSITYDMEIKVDGSTQFAQTGITDSSSYELQILTFKLSGYDSGDTVEFRVSNASGPNTYHNFAFLGGSISAVPEPSTWVMGMAGLTCRGWHLLRRGRRTRGR